MLPAASVENPAPKPESEIYPSVFYLPVVKDFSEGPSVETAEFPGCLYASANDYRFGKRFRWTGPLKRLGTLAGQCACTEPHDQMNTPELAKKTGEYSERLCAAYAKLMVDVWEENLRTEYEQATATRAPTSTATEAAPTAASSEPEMRVKGYWGNSRVRTTATKKAVHEVVDPHSPLISAKRRRDEPCMEAVTRLLV